MADAADQMGISAEAVRGRIRRGTLPVEREGGKVYVLLDVPPKDRTTADQPRTTADPPPDRTDALILELRDHVADLRGQLDAERKAHEQTRRLLGGALERIPAIEAPQDPPPGPGPDAAGSPETGSEERGGGPIPRDRETPADRPQSGTLRGLRRRILGW